MLRRSLSGVLLLGIVGCGSDSKGSGDAPASSTGSTASASGGRAASGGTGGRSASGGGGRSQATGGQASGGLGGDIGQGGDGSTGPDCEKGTTGEECLSCDEGTYCAGGDAEPVPCEVGTYDDDLDPATPCVSDVQCSVGAYVLQPGTETTKTECSACPDGKYSTEVNATTCTSQTICQKGQFVEGSGSTTSDRVCQPCASGTFTNTLNAAACTSWTECGSGWKEKVPGTPASDRVCTDSPWTTLWGTASLDQVSDVVADAVGGVYAAGDTNGAFPGQTSLGGYDVFLSKLNAEAGTVLWTTQWGSAAGDFAYGVTSDGAGGVYLVGRTDSDALLLKFDGATGMPLWTAKWGTIQLDWGQNVVSDAFGYVYVAGRTFGALSGQTSAGAVDAFVTKVDATTGAIVWSRQLGTTDWDAAMGVTVDPAGNVYLAGNVGAALSGQVWSGGEDVFLAKFDKDGNVGWTKQWGTPANDYIVDVGIDASGDLYVGGRTQGALPGQTSAGGFDSYVSKFSSVGAHVWTTQFGTTADDDMERMAVDPLGNAYAVGRTDGTFPGETRAGLTDAFLAKVRTDTGVVSVRQRGTIAREFAYGVAVDSSGSVYMGGMMPRMLGGQVQDEQEAFVMKFYP